MNEKSCQHCIHFDDDPAAIEAEFPRMTMLGSAYASARGHAGLCNALDRFLDPMPARCCTSFAPRADPSRPEATP